ncbi:MAG: amylo-alpha-1,6-glucosidase [Terracidiphilus sp.]
MRACLLAVCAAAAVLFTASSSTPAQVPAPLFTSIPAFPFEIGGPVIEAHTEALKPFTVAGERGVLLGQQDGTFEAWILPVKVLSDLTIEADIEGYTVPIDVNQQSAEIEVRPDRTVITYSHIGFTVRQIMFSPDQSPAGTGPIVLFEFDCLHPTDFTLRFTPNLEWMWPQRNEGNPGADWDEHGGFYVLHSDYPDFAAAVTIPGARPGIQAPYQERPQFYPTELKLHIDPVRDRGRLFPLLMAVGTSTATATNRALGETLAQLNAGIAAAYQAHDDEYKKLLANSVSIETPDPSLDEAFQWAVVSIEQLRAHAYDPHPTGSSETALVAGYYASGDSARPGFGWFFGRDALYTLYAVNGFGDFALSKAELEFLIRRQRDDGKIMHEYSQTAAALDWQAFPYEYAAADSTPLFLLAVADYVRASGDVGFLTTHRDAIEKAWSFETDPAHDTDHDGIYDNSQGTGWVESWPGGMPHQEIYLALLDQEASGAMAEIENLLGNAQKSAAAKQRAETIAKTIESEYYDAEKGCYAFSHNVDRNGAAEQDRTTTVYPAMAWWDPEERSRQTVLQHPEDCLKQFAADALNTDWGLRDVADNEKIYDGMSYHQGSVWPLFTGWAAMAEYRGGQPLAGYQLLMENANLTQAQDLGAVTELLSGDFYVPFGRSTSHQLWSSAMVITPILRGMFGILIDAQKKTITVNPRLPAGWNQAEVHDLPLPGASEPMNISVARHGDHLDIFWNSGAESHGWHLRSDLPGASYGPIDEEKIAGATVDKGLRVPLPALEINEGTLAAPPQLSAVAAVPDWPPTPGARSARFRVLHADYAERKLTLTIEGLAGADGVLSLVRHGRFVPKVQADPEYAPGTEQETAEIAVGLDAEQDPSAPVPLHLHFPPGEGWKTITVTLSW